MARPTNREARRVLESIQILNSQTSLSSLPDRLLRAVVHSVQSEITAYDEWNGRGVHGGTVWFDPPDSLPASLLEVFNVHVHEHPLAHRLVDARMTETLRISDCVRPGEFEKTALYNEFYTRVDVHHQMSTRLEIENELAYSCTVSRSRRDFTYGDRVALDLLKPHLVSAIRIGREIAKLRNDLQHQESVATKGILVLTTDMRPIYLNYLGERLIDKFFGTQRSPGLPTKLIDFVKREYLKFRADEYDVPEKLFISGPRGSELHCRVVWNETTLEISIILEERRVFAVEDYRTFGLTERESEILLWMHKGKSDETIASLCDISVRTVNKHLEHIYRKLGVESRLTAVQLARDFLGEL